MRRGSPKASRGPPEGCVRAACFWSEIPSRRSTAFAAPTLTPIWRQNAPFSRKMPHSIIEITANFRSRAPILDFANDRFQPLLSEAAGQPGFTPLAATRAASPDGHAVACFEVPIDDRHKDEQGQTRWRSCAGARSQHRGRDRSTAHRELSNLGQAEPDDAGLPRRRYRAPRSHRRQSLALRARP